MFTILSYAGYVGCNTCRTLAWWQIGEEILMKQNDPNQVARKPVEILRIILAVIAALAAVSLLVLNMVSFADTIDYYLAMGYPSDEVYKHLIPSQFLPGVFEPLAIYGGIAFLLFYVGRINRIASTCRAMSTEPDPGSNTREGLDEPEMFADSSAAPETVGEEEASREPVTNATANPGNDT